jgi:peptidoglycan/LPS O-acetylase OafA/YrhL
MKFRNPADLPGADLARFGTYVPFIDGLRAVSILAVVGFHVGLPGFSSGFVGVDVFFVISGYLIIGHITAALHNGSFSFADFWARRALRILPPFILVLAASTAIGSAVLVTPAEINDFGASVLYAAAMIANQFFCDQQGYFNTASDLKPLLHTWTLSVEEQFYLLVQLLAFGTAWIEKASKWRGLGLLFAVAIILFLASPLACVEYTSSTRNIAFFLMPFRAWEFIAGGMVPALIPLARRLPAILADLVAALGGIAILVAILAFSERLPIRSQNGIVGGGKVEDAAPMKYDLSKSAVPSNSTVRKSSLVIAAVL